MDQPEEYYTELKRLRSLCAVPSVQILLDSWINSAQPPEMRQPIKKTKAELLTIYINKGYAWGQSQTKVFIYVRVLNAFQLREEKLSLHLGKKSLELNIANHLGANHKFRINYLFDKVSHDNWKLKIESDQVVIELKKEVPREWRDLKMKSAFTIFDELQRKEALEATHGINQAVLENPFDAAPSCPHRHT